MRILFGFNCRICHCRPEKGKAASVSTWIMWHIMLASCHQYQVSDMWYCTGKVPLLHTGTTFACKWQFLHRAMLTTLSHAKCSWATAGWAKSTWMETKPRGSQSSMLIFKAWFWPGVWTLSEEVPEDHKGQGEVGVIHMDSKALKDSVIGYLLQDTTKVDRTGVWVVTSYMHAPQRKFLYS